jgi:hypothetical protein
MRMTAAIVGALQVLLCTAAPCGELSPELRGLIEHFQAHRRVAIGYLRTQNGDLGAVAIERLRDGLIADRDKMAPAAPIDMALMIAVARTEALVASSLKAIDDGNLERSRELLEEAGKPLNAWRQTNGIRLFSDCIAEISAAYETLDSHRLKPPDLTDAAAGRRVIVAVDGVTAVLARCEREATDDMRQEPEFRRLFDGMRASLRQMPGAVAARDGALLSRLLGEQRSIEQLLSFRFG